MERFKAGMVLFGSLLFIVILMEASVGGRTVTQVVSAWTAHFEATLAPAPAPVLVSKKVFENVEQVRPPQRIHHLARITKVKRPSQTPQTPRLQVEITRQLSGVKKVLLSDTELTHFEKMKKADELDFYTKAETKSPGLEFGEKRASLDLGREEFDSMFYFAPTKIPPGVPEASGSEASKSEAFTDSEFFD